LRQAVDNEGRDWIIEDNDTVSTVGASAGGTMGRAGFGNQTRRRVSSKLTGGVYHSGLLRGVASGGE
jgi:hypothetical protein